jgi:hypothetical protein
VQAVKEKEDYEEEKDPRTEGPPGYPRRTEEARPEEDRDGPYMRFDFRRGRMRWPGNAELIDPAKGTEMTDEARKEVSLRPFRPPSMADSRADELAACSDGKEVR